MKRVTNASELTCGFARSVFVVYRYISVGILNGNIIRCEIAGKFLLRIKTQTTWLWMGTKKLAGVCYPFLNMDCLCSRLLPNTTTAMWFQSWIDCELHRHALNRDTRHYLKYVGKVVIASCQFLWKSVDELLKMSCECFFADKKVCVTW